MQRFVNGARLTYVYSISQNKPHMIVQKIEKEIIMKKRPIYLLSLMLLGVFMIACDKNDNDTLTFDNQNVELFIDETTTVKVSGGAAPYTVKAADETIAEATVTGNVITLKALKEGTTTLKVTDNNDIVGTIGVKVTKDPFEEEKEDATVRVAWDTIKIVQGTDVGQYVLTKAEDKTVTFTWTEEAEAALQEGETEVDSFVLTFKDPKDLIGAVEEDEEAVASRAEQQVAAGTLTITLDGEVSEHDVASWRLVQAQPAEEGAADTYWIAFTANSKEGLVVAPLTEPAQ